MGHGEGDDEEFSAPVRRLTWIKSPLIKRRTTDGDGSSMLHGHDGRMDLEGLGIGSRSDYPEFQRYEDATKMELFFDLFFAANLSIFSQNHPITSIDQLSSYVGYYSILWFTWALVSLFDVRFVTDSIFDRITRIAHQATMMGFVVVTPNFDPLNQDKKIFQTMSIILMISRLVLCVQYGTIIWHVRQYKNTRNPLVIVIVVHFLAAMIYLGITFGFVDEDNNVYIAWYVVSVVEMALNIGLSLRWYVLSFYGTHLGQRLCQLTLITIGEGIVVVCTNVVNIVKNPISWTPPTIGVVLSSTATVYIIYLIYFDWQQEVNRHPVRQLVWVCLHFPFQVALTLFMEGAGQFIVWWKLIETLNDFLNTIDTWADNVPDSQVLTTAFMTNFFNSTVQLIFDQFPPQYIITSIDIDDAFNKLATIPDYFWNEDNNSTAAYNQTMGVFVDFETELFLAMRNSLFASFQINTIQNANASGTAAEQQVDTDEWVLFEVVLGYSLIAGGLSLVFMVMLQVVAHAGRWTRYEACRAGFDFLLGVGLALVSLVLLDPEKVMALQQSPWISPIICMTFFVVLALNHIPDRWIVGGSGGRRRGTSGGAGDGGPSSSSTGGDGGSGGGPFGFLFRPRRRRQHEAVLSSETAMVPIVVGDGADTGYYNSSPYGKEASHGPHGYGRMHYNPSVSVYTGA